MAVAVPERTAYTPVDYENTLGDAHNRVLFLCTEDGLLTCTNGTVFKTGNHPVEIFVVVLHLERAGFNVDLATPSGAPVPIEEFAIPQDDTVISDAMARYADQLARPLAMGEVLAGLTDASPYVAVYVPGGHGAVLSVPTSPEAKGILDWVLKTNRFLITICHGPAGLLSLALDEDPATFPLRGYDMAAFPDSGDRMMELIGYLPGEMPYFFNAKLEALGVKIVSHLPVGGVHTDRRVLSGDSPFAADKLGRLAAQTLLDSVHAEASA